MTTPRRRRNRDEQIRDLLEAKLTKQEASAADWKAGWEHEEWKCERTRRALAELGMEPLPGFEAPDPAQDRPQADQGVAPESAAVSVGMASLAKAMADKEPLLPPTPCPWDSRPHPHNQAGDCVTETP